MSEEPESMNRTLLGASKLEEELKLSKSLKASVLSHFDNSMYSIMNNASIYQLFAFEFTAAFLFTFAFCSSMIEYEEATQAAGAILMAISLATPLCGANINPMVSLSSCIKR